MIEEYFTQAGVLTRLHNGSLNPYLSVFLSNLKDAGYLRGCIRRRVRTADRLLRWLQEREIPLATATPRHVEAFVAQYKRAPARGYPSGRRPYVIAGLNRIVVLLQRQGIFNGREPRTPQECWLESFDGYLTQAQGLAPKTRRNYVLYAQRLMRTCFTESSSPEWGLLTAEQLSEFVRHEAARLQPGSCAKPVTAVRALMRFLTQQELVSPQLSRAIPKVREWRQAGLPRYLSSEDRDRVLHFCQQPCDQNARDRSIVLFLARLGVRAGEVRQLQLEDIDWDQGLVHVRRSKSRRERVLPLFEDTGIALAQYLRKGRPRSSARAVFLRSLPPYGPLECSSAISRIVAKLCRRAGVSAPHMGAHRFRHTAATHMVRGGASFKEIADVLGHRALATTAVYAKLDERSLAQVALPWPGGAQ